MSITVRDLDRLAREQFDLLVIGAGIHGAAAAWDAARRGFRTALIDKGDFGAATSAGCFKIVHGGLRYLQHLDFPRTIESAREQRLLRLLAPHLVRPLPFVIPCYAKGMRRRTIMQAGLSLYDLVTAFRNSAVPESHLLPRHRMISAEECLHIAPYLTKEGLSGGAVYYDCQMENCERLTAAVALSAAAAGAAVANYVEAVDSTMVPEASARRIESVAVRDALTGNTFILRARVVLVAAGPWSTTVAARLAHRPPPAHRYFSKGIQLVVPALTQKHAVAVESSYSDPEAKIARGGRSFFIQPWRNHSLLGTTDSLFEGDPAAFRIDREEIDSFLEDFRRAYPAPLLERAHVRYAFGGLRPLSPHWQKSDDASQDAKTARDDIITDHAASDTALTNMFSVEGVKYTTFRSVAERVINLVAKRLRGSVVPCTTAAATLYGGDIGDSLVFERRQQAAHPEHSAEIIAKLAANYGSNVERLWELSAREPALAAPVAPGASVLGAEIVHAVRHELAMKLSDVVLRRTALGTLGFPGEEALANTAALMARECGWSGSRIEEELAETRLEFSQLHGVSEL